MTEEKTTTSIDWPVLKDALDDANDVLVRALQLAAETHGQRPLDVPQCEVDDCILTAWWQEIDGGPKICAKHREIAENYADYGGYRVSFRRL